MNIRGTDVRPLCYSDLYLSGREHPMEIKVSCRLCYDIPVATAFIFQIQAAKADAQIINNEVLTLPSETEMTMPA